MTDIKNFQEATIEDLLANPHKFGIPTFEEFSRNPKRWRKSAEHALETAEKGSTTITGIKAHQYYVEGVECESLEQAQRIMGDMGYRSDEVEFGVNLEDLKNGQIKAHVYFRKKQGLILPQGY